MKIVIAVITGFVAPIVGGGGEVFNANVTILANQVIAAMTARNAGWFVFQESTKVLLKTSGPSILVGLSAVYLNGLIGMVSEIEENASEIIGTSLKKENP